MTIEQMTIKTNGNTPEGQWPLPPASWLQLARAGLDVASLRIGQTVFVEPESSQRTCCEHLERRVEILEVRLREARDLVGAGT